MNRKFLILLVLLLISSLNMFSKEQLSSDLRNQKTYYYDTIASITGVVDIEEHFVEGPNLTIHPHILYLSNPIKVVPGTANSDYSDDDIEINVKKIQLGMDDSQINKLREKKAYGKKIKVTGELYHWQTHWHVTEVLMSVESVEILN